jgi:FAD synthetase
MLDTVAEIRPDIIVLGYDQGFNEEELHQRLSDRGMGHIRVVRADECADDLNATRRIVDRIRKMGDQ